jgi:effector-binding domain-containing protein
MSASAITGMVTITDAAEMAAVGCWKNDSPVRNASAAGTGRAALVAVSEMNGPEIPGGDLAVMVPAGPFDDIDRTYGALGTVVAERGIAAPGPIREHYLADGRAEVCWPVVGPAASPA